MVIVDKPTASEAIEQVQPQISWQGTTLRIQAAEPLQRVQVYDIRGAQLTDRSANSTEVQINGSHWGQGTYIVVITTASHKQFIQKTVKVAS